MTKTLFFLSVLSLGFITGLFAQDDGGGLYKSGTDPVLSLKFQKDSFQAGDTAYADVLLGTASVPAKNVNGISFSFYYDPTLVDTNKMAINFKNTWLTPDTNYISITKKFNSAGRVDAGLTRTDNKPKTGYGKIGTLCIVIVDNIAGKRFVRKTLPLSFANVRIFDENNTNISFVAVNDTIVVYEFKTGIDEAGHAHEKLSIYPNPASDAFTVRSENSNIKEIKVCDMLGRQINDMKFRDQSACTLFTKDLIDGIYIVEVRTSIGLSQTYLTIKR